MSRNTHDKSLVEFEGNSATLIRHRLRVAEVVVVEVVGLVTQSFEHPIRHRTRMITRRKTLAQ